MRRLLITVSMAAALLVGSSVWTHAATQAPTQQPEVQQPDRQPQAQQPAQRAQSITGKVTSVSGRTFSVEVGEGASKRTMQFTAGASADISSLKEGDTVTVQYSAGANNQNMATKVDVSS
jgi:Cu/Ag efflux protein CusF